MGQYRPQADRLDGLSGLDADPALIDFVPVVGNALAADEARRAYEAGNIPLAGLLAAGIILPGAARGGKVAAKATQEAFRAGTGKAAIESLGLLDLHKLKQLFDKTHAIEMHAGKTDDFLASRVRGNEFRDDRPRIVRASTFSSVKSAEGLMSVTLSQNADAIKAYIDREARAVAEHVARGESYNPKPLAVFSAFGTPTGRQALAKTSRGGAIQGRIELVDTYKVGVSVVFDPGQELKFRIVTGYTTN